MLYIAILMAIAYISFGAIEKLNKKTEQKKAEKEGYEVIFSR